MKKIYTFFSILILSTMSLADQNYDVGIGTNYGGLLGGTVSVDLNENTEIFGGLGLTLGDSVESVIGAKFWVNDSIRLTGNYGYNCTVKTISTTTTYKDYYGLNVGAGYSFGGKDSNGVAVDLMLIDSSDCSKAAGSSESSSSVKITAGYRF